MAPAPRPSGIASRQSHGKPGAAAKPSSAAAVSAVETAVTRPVPNRLMSAAEERLEMMVPQQVTIVTALPHETGVPRSTCMAGHAAPKSESGMPRPTKAT